MRTKPIHSARRNLANIAYLLTRAILGAFASIILLALWVAVMWLVWAASTPIPTETFEVYYR